MVLNVKKKEDGKKTIILQVKSADIAPVCFGVSSKRV